MYDIETTQLAEVAVPVMRPSLRWCVFGLSVLSGSGWLLTQAYPSKLAFPFAGCIHFALIGLSGLLVAGRHGWERSSFGRYAGIAVSGACIVVLPGVVLELTAGGISSFTSVALFCGIPLVTVLGAGAFSKEGNSGQLLWPAVLGLLGALLLFPVELPGTSKRIICFATVSGCSILSGLASAWMHGLLRGMSVAQVVAVVGIFGASGLGLHGLAVGWPTIGIASITGEVARCAVFDLPLVWLTVWLVREVDPARLAARFLIAPLITAAEGYAIERGPLDVEKVTGLALMAAGAAMLLLKDEAEEAPGLRLR